MHHRTNQAERARPVVALCRVPNDQAQQPRDKETATKVKHQDRGVCWSGRFGFFGCMKVRKAPKLRQARNTPPTHDPHSAPPHEPSRAISARRGSGSGAERLSSAAPRRGDCYPRKVPRSRGLLERPVRLRGLHEGAESTHTSPKARNPPPTLDPHSARPHGSSRAISARRGPGVWCRT
jgi:hypothetical protein